MTFDEALPAIFMALMVDSAVPRIAAWFGGAA